MLNIREFCIVVLGEVDGVKDEVMSLSETDVRFINTDGLVVGTFKSAMTPNEIKTFLGENSRNFFLFEMGVDNFSVNFNDDNIYDHLFKEHEDRVAKHIDYQIREFGNINSVKDQKTNKTSFRDKIIKSIENLSKEEQTIRVDEILDKGINNWSEEDKIIIEYLTKNT